ncbi:condensation domain-containing protein [Streptomyces sp. V2I9]|uniref:condensation domain-containing protein n=1 Tax=Streptomyces sp. V2I9 TaxID=3042304 RepID=UPI00278A9ED6|nr:condensation domain-containing protein [Streptomyces sp. V2I9]MDQ0988744.1 hypothetical protein [Streptomyces sp. V2I9]
MTVNSTEPMTETLPIGPLQEGMWLFWRLNPASPAYCMPEIFHFEGEFVLEAVEFTFNELIRRHESLRTTFRETEAGAVQVIAREPEPRPVEVLDLRHLPEGERSERLQSAINAAANRPFDLEAEAGIRLTALRVSDSRTTLVLVAHHLVCDGLSMAVLLDEFGELYRSARRGVPAELGPVPPGYSTFVNRQLATLANGTYEEERKYWRERLAGITGSALPGAVHSSVRTPVARDTALMSLTLDDTLTESLTAFARRTRSTQFSVLLAVMKVMIAAATSEGTTVLGMATSGRTPEFERTVGLLANTIVIRSEIDLTQSFAETLGEVSLDLMEAIDHQDLPFSRMIADLDAEQQLGSDILRTVFTAGAVGSLKLGEGDLSEVFARTDQGPFDLHVACDIVDTGIALDWEYALGTYPHEVARGYAAAYQEILARLLGEPDAPMDSLGLAEVLARVPGLAGGEAAGATPAVAADRQAAEGEEGGQDAVFTPVEETVAAIWTEVLGVPVESPHDDFFDLGGHSLLVGATIAEVRQQVSQSATLRMLFDYPQLREFVSQLEVDGRPA